MKSLQKCEHCRQTLHYSEVCNSFVGKTYVRLRARLTLVCGQDLHALVEYTYLYKWKTHSTFFLTLHVMSPIIITVCMLHSHPHPHPHD